MSRLRRGIFQLKNRDAAPSDARPASRELLSPAPRRRGAAARVQSRSRNARHLFPQPVSGAALRCARRARRGGYLRFREPVGGAAVRGDGSDAHGAPLRTHAGEGTRGSAGGLRRRLSRPVRRRSSVCKTSADATAATPRCARGWAPPQTRAPKNTLLTAFYPRFCPILPDTEARPTQQSVKNPSAERSSADGFLFILPFPSARFCAGGGWPGVSDG